MTLDHIAANIHRCPICYGALDRDRYSIRCMSHHISIQCNSIEDNDIATNIFIRDMARNIICNILFYDGNWRDFERNSPLSEDDIISLLKIER